MILEKYFLCFFVVFCIGRIGKRQKIKGAVKQCIDWVDTLIKGKSVKLDVM